MVYYDEMYGGVLEGDGNNGSGGSGTVTGIAASVNGGTATITANGGTGSVKLTGTGGVDVKGNTTTGAVELDAKDLSDGTQSVSKDLKEARFIDHADTFISTLNYVTFLHFSDIHGDAAALGRIMAEKTAFGNRVNDAICTGDMVLQVHESIASWWNPAVMTVIGNHEAATRENNTWHWNVYGMAANAELFITPFVSNWGVVHTAGTTYYYKDYTTAGSANAGVRLIVIDEVLYMSDDFATDAVAQTAWLESTLASAVSSGLHVIIALHAPAVGANPQNCSFTRLKQTFPFPDDGILYCPSEVVNAVASSISSGLHFVGYLCGHIHKDVVYDVTGDRSQMMYSVTTANIGTLPITSAYNQWAYYDDKFRDDTLDAYNLVTIDTYNSVVTIVRGGGANIDCFGRPRETISIKYSTGEIIDREVARGVSKDAVDFRLESSKDKLSLKRYISTEEITGSTVTLQAGHAYQGIVSDTLTLNVETLPQSSYGLEGLLDVTLSGGTVVSGANNVIIDDVLVDGDRNICSVHYIDGIVLVKVLTSTSTIPAGAYAVTIASGTSDGSLYYGVNTSTNSYIYISPALNNQATDLGGATTNGSKTIRGNGSKSIVSGGIICTTEPTFSSLALNGAVISSGFATLSGIYIPSGGTVYERGGYFRVQEMKVDGEFDCTDAPNIYALYCKQGGATISGSGTIKLGGKAMMAGQAVYPFDISCVTIVGGSASSGGMIAVQSGANLTMRDAYVSGCTAGAFGGAISVIGGIVDITGCTFSNNSAAANNAGGFMRASGSMFIKDTVVTGCGPRAYYGYNGSTYISGCTFTNNTNAFAVMIEGGDGATVIDTVISGNFNSGNYVPDFVAVSATVVFSDCTLGSGRANNGGSCVFVGSNKVQYIDNNLGQGYVTIRSGAIVDMTGAQAAVPIAVSGAHITVATGGCTVIDAAGSSHPIAAGTYTQITSGGSAVAS